MNIKKIPQNLKLEPYDPVIPLLDLYLKSILQI